MRGIVGDLKRALADIPDDVYAVIPQDTDDGMGAEYAYWDGGFAYTRFVRDSASLFGGSWKTFSYSPGDAVIILSPGEDYVRGTQI